MAEATALDPRARTTSLRKHFKSYVKNGKAKLPHFASSTKLKELSKDVVVQSIEAMEQEVEARGLKIIDEALKKIEQGEQTIKTSEVIALLGKLQAGFSSKRMYELKKREMSEKDKNFNKVLLAGLYGGQIKEAELADDNKSDDEGDDKVRAIGSPSKTNEGKD